MILTAAIVLSLSAAGQILWRVTSADDAGRADTSVRADSVVRTDGVGWTDALKRPDRGAAPVSYILGTMHTADVAIADSIAGFAEAFAGAAAFYGELDSSDIRLSADILAEAAAPEDSTLRRLLTPAQYDSLTCYIRSLGLDEEGVTAAFDRFKPTMLDLYLTTTRNRENGKSGLMDIVLQRRAAAQGIRVCALETARQQMHIIMSMPVSEQIDALMEVVRNPDKAEEERAALTAAYRRHNLAAIERLIQASISGEYAERIMYSRNRTWADILTPVMRRQSLFVAVGAAHLVGDEGLLALLRRSGFRVTAVDSVQPTADR